MKQTHKGSKQVCNDETNIFRLESLNVLMLPVSEAYCVLFKNESGICYLTDVWSRYFVKYMYNEVKF